MLPFLREPSFYSSVTPGTASEDRGPCRKSTKCKFSDVAEGRFSPRSLRLGKGVFGTTRPVDADRTLPFSLALVSIFSRSPRHRTSLHSPVREGRCVSPAYMWNPFDRPPGPTGVWTSVVRRVIPVRTSLIACPLQKINFLSTLKI